MDKKGICSEEEDASGSPSTGDKAYMCMSASRLLGCEATYPFLLPHLLQALTCIVKTVATHLFQLSRAESPAACLAGVLIHRCGYHGFGRVRDGPSQRRSHGEGVERVKKETKMVERVAANEPW